MKKAGCFTFGKGYIQISIYGLSNCHIYLYETHINITNGDKVEDNVHTFKEQEHVKYSDIFSSADNNCQSSYKCIIMNIFHFAIIKHDLITHDLITMLTHRFTIL